MKSAPLISQRDRILGGLWGSLARDALGVPVEFQSPR
jgi:ADP-ribosylglycohydrolase